MKGKRNDPDPPRRTWARFAVLISFGGGLVGGIVGSTGVQDGWQPALYILGGASVVILGVALLLSTRTASKEEKTKPLPGDVYGDREKPEPHSVDQGSLNGRVPFSESKSVAKSSKSPEQQELYDQLENLNKQLQRANVKLGLGEISREGYTKIVKELKERRARVEAEINGANLEEHAP